MMHPEHEASVPETGSDSHASIGDEHPLARRLLLCGAGAVAVWLFLLASHLWRTDSPLWHQGPNAPLGIFSFLGGSYTFSWANTPPLELLIALAALGVYWGIGWLLLRGMDVYFGRAEETALALLFGSGICGIGFELLGMMHLLTRWPVLVVTGILAGGLWTLARIRRRSLLETWDARAAQNLGRQARECEPVETGFEVPRERFERTRFFGVGPMPSVREAAAAYGDGPPNRRALRRLWRGHFAAGLATGLPELTRAAWILAALLVAVITALTFHHAIFYPETYWDSLILYLGYGRLTWLEGGFPFKASAQVGIGLGANYPHLFSTHAAAVAAVAGWWSDLPARLWAPTAALAATLLVYGAALRLWRNRLVAILCALVFRALPYTIAYSTYASDYALAMLFVAGFLYLAVCYIESPLPGYFTLLTLLPALAMHLNYLMGVLWIAWAATCLAAHWPRPKTLLDEVAARWRSLPQLLREEEEQEGVRGGDIPHSVAWAVPGVFGLLWRPRFWVVTTLALLLASPWYARNLWMTGNPVYAFFPGIFGGIRINHEVLRSAEHEWFLNGDGIGRVAELIRELRERPDLEGDADSDGITTQDDQADDSAATATATLADATARETLPLPPPRTLGDRLRASWMYWVGFETFHWSGRREHIERGRWRDRLGHLLLDWKIPDEDHPFQFGRITVGDEAGSGAGTAEGPPGLLPGTALLHWRHAYKLAPTTVGLALPGFVFWLVLWAGSLFRRRGSGIGEKVRINIPARVGFVTALTAVLFFAYEYVIADLYLYQILPVVAALALLPGWVLGPLEARTHFGKGRHIAILLFIAIYIQVLMIGLVPGTAMALMGFKFSGARRHAGEWFTQGNLAVFRNPGLPPEEFLRLQYGDDVPACESINRRLAGQRLLTHENRHYLLDPSITLVHLDDWEIQRAYPLRTDRERMDLFRSLGIRYYYRVPNEERHLINRRAGIQEWIGTPLLRERQRWGENVLYELIWEAVGLPATPPDPLPDLADYLPRNRWEP